MAKTRRDPKGRTLQKGESYLPKKRLYRFTYTDPTGKRQYFCDKDLLALRDREKEVRRDMLDGIDSYVRASCTFDYLFERFISTKTNLRSSTRTNYIYTYRRYVKEAFGRKKIGDIKYSDIKLFYQRQLERGLSLGTVDSMHRIISASFKLAVRDDVIRKSPAEGVMAEIKSEIKERAEKHPLTYEEETEFLKYLEQPKYQRWRPLFIFMFGTGCRVSETIGIRWEDIDLSAGEVDINHDVTYCPREKSNFRCEYEVGPPKTAAGERTIPLMKKVKEVLTEERDRQEKYGIRCRSVIDGMSGFVFSNRDGEIHNPSSINKEIKRIVDDHNSSEVVKAARENRKPVVIPYFSCHITRHTFCARLCENGTNIKLIQQIMGHSDIRTTMDIYAEVTKAKAHSAFQELNEEDVL